MKKDYKKISIGAFLISGTILSLYIALDCVSDFVHMKTLIYRNPPMIYLLLFDFVLVLPVAGMLSIWSFFTKGDLWKPITKGIIINIYMLLGICLFTLVRKLIFYPSPVADLILIALVAVFALLPAYLWKAVNSVHMK